MTAVEVCYIFTCFHTTRTVRRACIELTTTSTKTPGTLRGFKAPNVTWIAKEVLCHLTIMAAPPFLWRSWHSEKLSHSLRVHRDLPRGCTLNCAWALPGMLPSAACFWSPSALDLAHTLTRHYCFSSLHTITGCLEYVHQCQRGALFHSKWVSLETGANWLSTARLRLGHQNTWDYLCVFKKFKMLKNQVSRELRKHIWMTYVEWRGGP